MILVLCIFLLTCTNIDMHELVPYGDNNVFRVKFKYPKLLRVNLLASGFPFDVSKINNEGREKNWCSCALAGFLECVCFFSALLKHLQWFIFYSKCCVYLHERRVRNRGRS